MAQAPGRGMLAMGMILGMMISIFVGAILVNEFEGVMDDQRPGASTDFNTTVDDIISYTWVVFLFFALGILIVGGAWVINATGLIGA